MEMNKTRKYLLRPAKILIVIWVLSTILTKCGDMQISYDVLDKEDDVITILKNEAIKSRETLYPPAYLNLLIEDIEKDSTYSNQEHFFFKLNNQVCLKVTYVKNSKCIFIDSMSDYIWPLENIVTFQHPRVSAATIITSINEFKKSVLEKNNIEYSENWFNCLSIYMAFFDDYQYYILLIIILLLSLYINYGDALKYEQYTKMNADEET